MKPRVLITYNIFGELYREILADFEVTMPAHGVESFTYDEVLSMIGGYDALLSMWNFPVDKQLYGARYVGLDELFSGSDVVSLNAPLRAETYHIVDGARLAQMKPSAFLINTARGALVDERALVEALRSGSFAGAGLDVYEFDDTVSRELPELDNTVLTPHIGTQTMDGRREMAQFAATNIANFFCGGRVARVNKID